MKSRYVSIHVYMIGPRTGPRETPVRLLSYVLEYQLVLVVSTRSYFKCKICDKWR